MCGEPLIIYLTYLCSSSVAKGGEPEVGRGGREKDLYDFAAHVQLSKSLTETLGSHDDLVDHISTGEVKVESFVSISCLNAAVSQHSRLL